MHGADVEIGLTHDFISFFRLIHFVKVKHPGEDFLILEKVFQDSGIGFQVSQDNDGTVIFSQGKQSPGFDDVTVGIEIPFLVDIGQIDCLVSVIEDTFPFAPLKLHIAQVQVGNCFKLDIFHRSSFT